MAGLLFQSWQAREHRDIAGRPPNVRWREAKHIRRRLIEPNEPEVAPNDDDGDGNGIKGVDRVGRGCVCGPVLLAAH